MAKKHAGVWALIKPSAETGGIWDRLGEQLGQPDERRVSSGPGVWGVLQNRPGGLWDELASTTVVMDISRGVWQRQAEGGRGGGDIWQEANEETLILPRDELIPDLWREAGAETLIVARPALDVWEEVSSSRDFATTRPVRRLGWALKQMTTSRGETYYVLKNLREGTYLHLSQEELFVWNLLDGSYTVQDLAVAYMAEFKTLAISSLLAFLSQLQEKGFLTTQRTNVYSQLEASLNGRGVADWIGSVVRTFLRRGFPIRGVDPFITRTYQAGIKYIYSLPVQIALLLCAVLGFVAFAYLLIVGRYPIVKSVSGSLSLGLVGLFVGRMITTLIHEGGHAYTCKHFGREVHKAGVMIYFGAPAMYVDTSDIWMEKRARRILTTWAGPYCGLIIGGAASLVAVFSPLVPLNAFLFQLACLAIIDSLLNLNPLLKWDGYYILMDWLEMPRLRERALGFVFRGGLLGKLKRRKRFSREERVFAVYGLLSGLWTVFVISSSIGLYGKRLFDAISGLFHTWMLIPLGAGLLILIAALLVGRTRRARRRAAA
jgi:putative peptide zinc metalloprotease protein